MKPFSMPLLALVLVLASCAQVPTQSVELSTVLGSDLAQTQHAHLALVDMYYARVEADANRFVDSVYAPYQLDAALKQNPQIAAAIASSAGAAGAGLERQRASDMVKVFLTDLHGNTEDFRKKNLAPIRQQRALVAARIAASYDNMLRANTAVTAYLSSVARLNAAQAQALSKIAPPGLQQNVSHALADVSDKLDTLHKDASKEIASGRGDVKNLVDQFELLMQLGTAH